MPESKSLSSSKKVVDRRDVLQGLAAAGFMATAATPAAAQKEGVGTAAQPARFAYTGCRTTKERNARGEGINVFRVQQESGRWEHVQLLKTASPNPSFLAFDRSKKFLYAVHGDVGDVSAYAVDGGTGKLTPINQQPTGGRNPVHLLADTTNKFLTVANYATGSVAVLPIRADGGLDPLVQLVQLEGEGGPHAKEQSSPHPHEIVYDRARQAMLIPDKGVDRVFTFTFDAAKGSLSPGDPAFVKTRPGAGPRHIVFSPAGRFAYVNYELDSSIAAYKYDPDKKALSAFQVVPSVPDTFTGANTSSEIDITADGRFVYISNRGHDSVGVFAVDEASGRLTPVDWVSSQGKGPRFMIVDPVGRHLYTANENSDTIVAFRIDRATGRLTYSGETINTGSPTCILFS